MENKESRKSTGELRREEMEKIVGGSVSPVDPSDPIENPGPPVDLDTRVTSKAHCRVCGRIMRSLIGGKHKCDNSDMPCPEFGVPKGDSEVNWY